mgnify:CR=1 FL=1
MKITTWLGGIALSLSMTGSPVPAEALKVATISPEGTIWSQQIIDFMDKAKEAGVGLEFEYFPSGQLGNQPDTLKGMLSGRVDIWVGVMPFLSAVTPEVNLFTMPYAFEDLHELKCVVPKMEEAIQRLADGKYELVNVVPVGVQDIASASPVRVPSDLAGKKVRVAPLPSTIAFFKSIGATPQPLPGAETASALQTGLVEAVDLIPSFLVLTGSHKVAKYHIPTEHNYNLGVYAVSKRAWAKLNEAQRAALKSAGEQLDFGAQVDDLVKFDEKILDKGASEGLESSALSAEEAKAWREAGLAVWDSVLADAPGDMANFRIKLDSAKTQCK